MLGSMKTQSALTIFHFWYQKMICCFLFSYGSCSTPRSRTKRTARTQAKMICCFWLLQTTYMEEMKAGSTGPPVQLSPLSPINITRIQQFKHDDMHKFKLNISQRLARRLDHLYYANNIKNFKDSVTLALMCFFLL